MGKYWSASTFNFFTGKPEIEDLGYAFLFRNYQANTGKWQTSDPLGYPDGWNNLAYVNNGVTMYIDWQGTLVAGVFYVSKEELVISDGLTVPETVNVFSGDGAYKNDSSHEWELLGPIPQGVYYIVNDPKDEYWQLWRRDDKINDIAESNSMDRTNFRLCCNVVSHGCIVAYPGQASWDAVVKLLNETRYGFIQNADDKKNYRYYGTITVSE